MIAFIAALALMVQTTSAASGPPADEAESFRTDRSLAQLENCLSKELSERGDVTAVKIDAQTTTVMLRVGTGAPMLIDLAPPRVRVTTKFLYGTRELIKRCL
jgi:hypothetical protein